VTPSLIHRGLTSVGGFFAHPLALVALAVFVAAWLKFDRASFDWEAVGTITTLVMAVIIQRNQQRDTAALQLKLDELIHATSGARDEVAELERKSPAEIERLRTGG
jgi:low affinity Fe/Cu permease